MESSDEQTIVKFATSTCLGCDSAPIAYQGIATHTSPRLRYESGRSRSLQRSPVRVSFQSSRQASVPKLLGWSCASPGSATYQLQSATSFTGFQSGEVSTSRSPLWSVTAWLVLRRNTWWNCAILLAPDVGRQCLRSAPRGDLVVPRFWLQTFGHRAFAVSGPQIWNSPPLRIRQSRDNLLLFKQKLKAHLFPQF